MNSVKHKNYLEKELLSLVMVASVVGLLVPLFLITLPQIEVEFVQIFLAFIAVYVSIFYFYITSRQMREYSELKRRLNMAIKRSKARKVG